MRIDRSRPAARTLALLVALVTIAAAWPLLAPAGPVGRLLPHTAAPEPPSLAPGRSVEIAPAYHLMPGVVDLGPLPTATPLRIAVGLAPTDPSGLTAQEVLEYTPGTPQYRHFLGVTDLTARFGPSASEYASAAAYFRAFGLTVTTSPDRLLLLVSGPSMSMGRAFHTNFEQYSRSTGSFYSHSTPATLPGIAGWTGAVGLGNEYAPRPSAHPWAGAPQRVPLASCPGAFGLTPCQVHTAYDENGLLGSGINGTGITIGVVDTYDSAETQPTLASDFSTFASDYSLPSGKIRFVYPVPTSTDLNSSKSSQWGTEEGLDLEWARAAAPGDSIDMTLAPDASAGLYASVDWLVAHQAVNVLSLSWGEPDVGIYNPRTMPCSSGCNASSDGSYTLLHPVLQAAVVEGISVFSASGDCGAAEGTIGVSTGYPASDPSVTGVGGTDLSINASDGWTGEVGWSGNSTGNSTNGCVNQGGSGGGYSPFPRPWWQAANGLPSTPDVRAVPDISIIGGSAVSVVLGGSVTAVAGTSESTPIWAGIAAIADQYQGGGGLGSLNPSLYAVARSGSYSLAFHDITSGNNGYSAGSGWDAVTGLGSPIVGALVPLLAGPSSPPPGFFATVHASPRFGPVGLVTTFQAAATGGTGSYRWFDIDFGDGNASLVPTGSAVHTYSKAGVYTVRATAIDSSANSSVAPAVAVVVGGGTALNVSLSVNSTAPAVGAPVNFSVQATGGQAPYRYNYSFGDGTYLDNTSANFTIHTFGSAGSDCAVVEVRDLRSAPDGGASPRVALSVGGAAAPPCERPTAPTVTLGSSYLRADLPGDFPFSATVGGGVDPITTQLTSDDRYVGACNCGIFRTAGNHGVTVYANDSLIGQAQGQLNITTYPAISTQFSASAPSGVAPLSETFAVSASGGRLLNPAQTYWSFGDGATGRGVNVGHVYTNPGLYVAIGNLSDYGFGNASEAFLVDVLPSAGGGIVLTANVTPAVHTASGAPMAFRASASGGTGPYRFHWDLGDQDSAFGAEVNQTYSPHGCLANGTCPLVVVLSVTDGNGAARNATITLAPFFSARWSALTLLPTVPSAGGMTPFPFRATAPVAGISPVNVSWTYGDGGVGWGTIARHTFLLPGNFTVLVRATDAVGDVLLRTYAYTITGTPQSGPTVSGGPNVSAGVAPLAIGFSVVGGGGAGGPYAFNWSFGDSSPWGNGSTVSHWYNSTGVYHAVVTVSDSIGDTGNVGFTIDVYNTTLVQTTATPAFTSSGNLHLALRVVASCGPASILGCSDALVRVQLTWSKPTGSPFRGNPDAGVVSFPASGFSNVTIGVPAQGGTYHLDANAIGPAFSGGVTLILGIQGTSTTLGGLTIDPSLILALGGVFSVAMAAMIVATGGPRRTPPGGRVAAPGPINP
ncbi:MAG: PKD domain-containing protein [Thermoplasmata archaeon]|nr:PKD domain-containing protein [Thermoplasmata archaeon]